MPISDVVLARHVHTTYAYELEEENVSKKWRHIIHSLDSRNQFHC